MSNISIKKSSAIASVVIVGLVCFGAGYFSSGLIKSKTASGPGQMMLGAGQRGTSQGAGRMIRAGSAGGFVNGELLKQDSGSMTVKLRDGSTKLILVTSSTKALKMADTTLDQFTVGSEIMVSGATNSDGSITAQTVQTRPTPPAGLPTPEGTSAPLEQPKQ